MRLDEYQRLAVGTDHNRGIGNDGRVARILGLASEAGAILEIYKRLLRDNIGERHVRALLKRELGDVLWFCATIAAANRLRLSDIASANIRRAHGRYGGIDFGREPKLERNAPLEQRFPRQMVVQFAQQGGRNGRKSSQPILLAAYPNAFPNGSRPGSAPGKRVGYDVGGPFGAALTDHQRTEDGYRFHDALHMAFMANLHWSPVMRYLLRIKRKHDEDVEEGEDSQRQSLAEEALAAVLAQMAKTRLGFSHPRCINDEVMEVVRAVTNDTDVRACSDALWARAISQGFTAMGELFDNGGGYLLADLDRRTLTFSKNRPRLTSRIVSRSAPGRSISRPRKRPRTSVPRGLGR